MSGRGLQRSSGEAKQSTNVKPFWALLLARPAEGSRSKGGHSWGLKGSRDGLLQGTLGNVLCSSIPR